IDQVPGICVNHCAIKKISPFNGPAPNHAQLRTGKSQRMKNSDEFIEPDILLMHQQLFFRARHQHSQIAFQGTMLDRPFYAAQIFAKLDPVPWRAGTETSSIRQKVDRFQEVRLSLAVFTKEEIGSRRERKRCPAEVTILKQAEVGYPHT